MKYILVFFLLATASAAMAQIVEDAEHRADRLRTQQLNRDAAAAIARRDRGRAYAAPQPRSHRYVSERNQQEYRAARARYEREMADWRRRVDACQAGYYDACDTR